ncbi:hypothetical protein RM553_12690 [Zunongwangia sp. F363]|uniref:Uncharacterized protein n=1 Tax=Autumnicola tepida TaxID=3075595 RepID=A0ABU3CBV2_9FLAO|nr:hypothetical protein [Zunongwangia sp. F363]MDT0643692.1 hypothetical protein [Zunongwangia sp. F363]
MPATLIVTGNSPEEEIKKTKELSFIANNCSALEIERLGKMARSQKAREMLNKKWAFLKTFI